MTVELEADRRPELIIRPSAGWRSIDARELWRYRDLFSALAGRDVKLRYRQTALGVSWVVLQPLLGAGIFSFIFGRVAKLPSNGIPYFVFSYAGLLGWNMFQSTVTKAGSCMVANSGLVSKIFFPRLLLPLSTVPATILDFSVALGVMGVLLAIYGLSPGIEVLLLPVWVLLVVGLALGIGLFAAALNVSYRDVAYIIPVLMQFLLYGSPVAYSLEVIPDRYRFLYSVNPLVGILEGFRWSLLPNTELNVAAAVWSAGTVVVLLVFGALAFRRLERRFADVI